MENNFLELYKPKSLDKLIYSEDEINTIRKLLYSDKNFLFYGCHGSGKNTILKLLLNEYHKVSNIEYVNVNQDIKLDNTTTSIKYWKYKNIIWIRPEFLSNYEKQGISYIIDNFGDSKSVSSFFNKDEKTFLIISNIDKLNYFTQNTIKNYLLQNNSKIKYILISSNINQTIQDFTNLCNSYKLKLPSFDKLKEMEIMNEYLGIPWEKIYKLSKNNLKLIYLNAEYYLNNNKIYNNPINIIIDLCFKKKYDSVLLIQNIIYNLISLDYQMCDIINDIIIGICNKIPKNKIHKFMYYINDVMDNEYYNHSIFWYNKFIAKILLFIVENT